MLPDPENASVEVKKEENGAAASSSPSHLDLENGNRHSVDAFSSENEENDENDSHSAAEEDENDSPSHETETENALVVYDPTANGGGTTGGNEHPHIPSYLIEAPLALQGDQANDDDAQFPPGYDQPNPHTMPFPAPAYPGPSGAHTSYAGNVDTQRYIDYQLSNYPTYHQHVVQGRVPRDGPHPSYYTGPEGQYGGYPGRIFFNAGMSQNDWGPAFWDYQGGHGSGSGGHFGGNGGDGDSDEDDE